MNVSLPFEGHNVAYQCRRSWPKKHCVWVWSKSID